MKNYDLLNDEGQQDLVDYSDMPAIREMNLQTEEEYVETFNVSEPMAHCAIKHKNSDYYYISKYNYTCFNDNAYREYTGTTLAEIYQWDTNKLLSF